MSKELNISDLELDPLLSAEAKLIKLAEENAARLTKDNNDFNRLVNRVTSLEAGK
jgi:uncharacterized protein YacL